MAQQHLGPADVPQLLQVLQGSLSHDASIQKAAEITLRSLETRPGYCSCLLVRSWNHHCKCPPLVSPQHVLAAPAVDHSLRWLAATQVKNAVVRHWRLRGAAPGAISDDEKMHLRTQLLCLVDQDDNQVHTIYIGVCFGVAHTCTTH